MVSAVVTDTDGVATLTGGTLADKMYGTNYGAFSTPGGQGTFVYAMTWSALYQAHPISFAPGGSEQRVLTSTFFDMKNRTTSQDLTLTLQCGSATDSPCSDSCKDLATDESNCGSCGNACANGAVFKDAHADSGCRAGHCSAVDDSDTLAGASCNAMCQTIGAKCVTNTCLSVPSGAGGPHYETASCSDTWHVCCCQQ
jgi:hypothetical protein